MSTTYTGNPAATQAPSDPPAAGNAPKGTLPADGDALTAASVAQMAKVALDYAAFEKKPFGNTSAWAQVVKRFQNARLQDRFAVNHMAHPEFRGIEWTERWRGDEDTTAGSFSVQFEKTVERWFCVSTGTASRIRTLPLTTLAGIPGGFSSRFLQQIVDGGAFNLAKTFSDFQGIYINLGGALDKECWVETDIFPTVGETGNPSNCAYTFGLGTVFADDTSLVGGVFEKKSTDATWFAVTGDGSALSARVNTTVPPDSSGQTLRVEWWPSGVADDSIAQVKFYINGTLRGTITSNLPSAAAAPRISVFLGAKRITGSGATVIWAPVRYSAAY